MINVLVVHHSSIMRKKFSKILAEEEDFDVLTTETLPKSDLQKTADKQPDIILMEAPGNDDEHAALEEFLTHNSMPIVLIGENTVEDTTHILKALQKGVVDFFIVPADEMLPSTDKQDLISKLRHATRAKVKRFKPAAVQKRRYSPSRKKIIVLVSSTGGPQTLEALLTQLPRGFPVPILIVQHMPPHFTRWLADRLNRICEIDVKEAVEGDELKAGVALIAPGDYHMELKSDVEGFEGIIALNQEPQVLGLRPCGDKLFESAVEIFKENVIGVVLTGMGRDGTKGARAIKEKGGTVIAEDKESCVIYGMPKSVVDAGLADEVVTLEKMGVALAQLADI